MQFEWDENKNRVNRRKHDGITFHLARRAFDDPNVLIEEDRVAEDGEELFHAIGRINNLVLLVVYIYKETQNGEEIIRIISARAAGKNEIGRYFRQAAH